MKSVAPFTRRQFLFDATRLSALYALAGAIPLPAFSSSFAGRAQMGQTPVVDAGYAAVYKVKDGIYATISDTSKGFTTICNGGFLFGKDAGLVLEGFGTPLGSHFQLDAYHKVAQVPVTGALLTHYHFDHSMGNTTYGANSIQFWGHANVAKRMMESYGAMQGADRAAFLAPSEKRVQNAKNDNARQHALGDLGAITNVFDMANKTSLAFPNRPLDPAKLPLHVDLGHFPLSIEHFPGHSGTDIIVRAPEQKVVFTGDLVFSHSYPACFDEQCSMSSWRSTLKTFASWDTDTTFVPGHGPICGQEGIQSLRDLFDDLGEQAEKMHKAGVPLTEAFDQYIIPDKFKTYPVFAWGFCIGGAMAKLYSEMDAH